MSAEMVLAKPDIRTFDSGIRYFEAVLSSIASKLISNCENNVSTNKCFCKFLNDWSRVITSHVD